MMHAIGRELEAELQSRGCPLKVVDRETATPATWTNPRIVIEHAGDTFAAPRVLSINPKRHYERTIGGKITIFAKSAKPGALEFEHRHIAEEVLDQVLVAMRYVAARRLNSYTLGAGKFIPIKDLEKSDAQGGAVYELAFSFSRAVTERTWVGDFQPEGSINGFSSRSAVSLRGVADDDGDPNTPSASAETACGG